MSEDNGSAYDPVFHRNSKVLAVGRQVELLGPWYSVEWLYVLLVLYVGLTTKIEVAVCANELNSSAILLQHVPGIGHLQKCQLKGALFLATLGEGLVQTSLVLMWL